MNKELYILVAKTIKALYTGYVFNLKYAEMESVNYHTGRLEAIIDFSIKLADDFGFSDPAFSRGKFFYACGTIAESANNQGMFPAEYVVNRWYIGFIYNEEINEPGVYFQYIGNGYFLGEDHPHDNRYIVDIKQFDEVNEAKHDPEAVR